MQSGSNKHELLGILVPNHENAILANKLEGTSNLNRLTHAVFTQDKYNETLTYDKNSNIQSLIRKGKVNTSYSVIDQLSYKYHSNRLLSVNDLNTTETQAHGFNDNGLLKTGNPTDPLTHEYTYDVNGNMLSDANKMLHILSYNYLNLPDSIDF